MKITMQLYLEHRDLEAQNAYARVGLLVEEPYKCYFK